VGCLLTVIFHLVDVRLTCLINITYLLTYSLSLVQVYSHKRRLKAVINRFSLNISNKMCARPGQGGCAAAPTCRAASLFPRSANGPPTSEPAELFSRLAHRRRQHLARSSVRSAVHQLGYARCASSFRLFCNLLASQRRRATSLPISRVRRTRDSTAVGPRSVAVASRLSVRPSTATPAPAAAERPPPRHPPRNSAASGNNRQCRGILVPSGDDGIKRLKFLHDMAKVTDCTGHQRNTE